MYREVKPSPRPRRRTELDTRAIVLDGGRTNLGNYPFRVLLHAGDVTWPVVISLPRTTAARPHRDRKASQQP